MRYNKEKRLFMVKKYHELKNWTLVRRAWRSNFKNLPAPTINTLKRTVKRLNDTGSVASLPPLRAGPSEKREKAKNKLEELFLENPSLSIRKASLNVGVSYDLVRRILKEDLHLKPYKLHEWHQLLEGDYQKRLDFADFFIGLPKNALSLLICCDEAYFILLGKSTVKTIDYG